MEPIIHNPKLKELLQSLVKAMFVLFESDRNCRDGSREEQWKQIGAGQLDSRMTELEDFPTCVDLMKNDVKMTSLRCALVGTALFKTGVGTEEDSILAFLKRFYRTHDSLDDQVFSEEYLCFEELFYSDTLRIKETARLYNFESDIDSFDLGDELRICRLLVKDDPQEKALLMLKGLQDRIEQSDFVLEGICQEKKKVGEFPKPGDAESERESAEAGDLLDLGIDALRLLKPSGVYRAREIISEYVTFHPYAGRIGRGSSHSNMAVGEKCIISGEELNEIKRFYEFFRMEKESRFRVARRRLSMAPERKSLEDRLIDCMIGLEALCLPDGNTELTFKLSLRVAFLVSDEGARRKETFEFLTRMYGVRSKIVHGVRPKVRLGIEDVSRIEELLRCLIKLWIRDKDLFSPAKLLDMLF